MKKTFMICGIAYTVICTGMGIWMICKPEAYGKWTAKFFEGFVGILEGKEKAND